MRVAVVFHDFHLEASLPRERVHLARGLVGEGIDVHCYTNPETRGVEPAGIEFHDVRPTRRSDGRVGYAVECGSFAWKATALLREHRARYDVIDVAGTAAWEHDVVRVQAVPAAMQRRWPEFAGRNLSRSSPARSVRSHSSSRAGRGAGDPAPPVRARPLLPGCGRRRAGSQRPRSVFTAFLADRIEVVAASDRAPATEPERPSASTRRALRRSERTSRFSSSWATTSSGRDSERRDRGDGFGEPERPPRRGRGRRRGRVPRQPPSRLEWPGAGSFR